MTTQLETVDQFNARVPVGTAVHYFPFLGDSEYRETRTRSQAWALGHGDAVVKIDGIAGGVCIDHVRVAGSGAQT